jgi:hypothetical protein
MTRSRSRWEKKKSQHNILLCEELVGDSLGPVMLCTKEEGISKLEGGSRELRRRLVVPNPREVVLEPGRDRAR